VEPVRRAPSAAATAAPAGDVGTLIALAGLLAIAGFMLLAPIVHALIPVTRLPDPLPDHHQDGETLIFILAFAVLLPLAVWAAGRIAERIAAGPNAAALPALTAALAVLLALALLAARASTDAVLALGGAVWLALAAAGLYRAASSQRWGLGERLASQATRLWIAAAALLAATTLAFTHTSSVSWPALIAGAALIAAFVFARERLRLPHAGRRIGLPLDAAVIVLLLLAVPNLAVFAGGGGTEGAVETAILQFHQNFFLGPANQILHGDAMLVDTLSQYGVGSIYFLAGLFNVIPISNASLGLIEGLLSALMFIGAWAVMRIAGVSRPLAAGAMAVAVIALVYGLQYPLGGLLQHGAFRFGLPIGVVVGAVAESRWPRHATPARLLQLLTIAVASIWALEAFAYTTLTVLAVIAVGFFLTVRGERKAFLLRWVVQLIAACLLAHLLLAAITLIATGELPDWGWYINTLREFLFGQIGDLTYDFSPWSPALAVGALYLVSAAAIAILIRRRPDLALSQRTLLVALAGMTAFGVALFSYIVNRSADHIIPYVCLPAVTIGALWISLLERPAFGVSAGGRRAGWVLGLAVSALLIATAASSVDARFHQSALAFARPGGASFADALDRTWNPPPVRPQAAEGQQLLAQQMPGESRSSVITSADLSVEILTRSERGSAVPLGDPWEDSFVPDDHLAPLGDYVAGLEPGDKILIDPAAREVFETYQDDPERNPLETPAGGVTLIPSGLATLQEWVLREIGKTYGLKTVATSPSGLEVVELVPRLTASLEKDQP